MNIRKIRISRKKFILWLTAIIFGILSLRFLIPAKGPNFCNLKKLSTNQARILSAIYQTITMDRNPKNIKNSIAFMDKFISNLSSKMIFEFKAVLFLIEHSPLIINGNLFCFSYLDQDDQIQCIRQLLTGIKIKRPIYTALKEISYLGYYTNSKNWAKIGYNGPIVSEGFFNLQIERRYSSLIASEIL